MPVALKKDIRSSIESFFDGEAMYRKLAIPYKRGLLFSGPPGNGKTMLLKVIAASYPQWKFIYFKDDPHKDNDDIDDVFDLAKDMGQSIICFEDLDTLFRRSITLSHFLNKIDGFEDQHGMMIVATTNHPEDIDPALTSRPSRFDRVYTIGNPDYDCRRALLGRYFEKCCSVEYLETIANSTDSFSMAYLRELYISSSMTPSAKGWKRREKKRLERYSKSLPRR